MLQRLAAGPCLANPYLASGSRSGTVGSDVTPGKEVLEKPMTWGFLATFLVGVFGFIGFLVLGLGYWPILELPVLTPVGAYSYMTFRFRNTAGFARFLAGYGLCLLLFISVGMLYFVLPV